MSSTNITVNPVDSVMESIKSMSFMDLVALQVLLATHVKSESKKTTKAIKAKDPSAPKKKPSAAFLAFGAFKTHLETTQPDLFVGVPLMTRGTVVSAYRAEHEAEYNAFKDNFIATYDPSAEKPAKAKKTKKAVVEAPVVAEAPVKAKKAKKEVEAPVVSTSNVVEEKPKKEKKTKKEADVDKPKKTTKKSKEVVAESKTLPSKWVKIEEDGVTFYHNTIDNTVWDINDDHPTDQVGTYNTTTKSIEWIEM